MSFNLADILSPAPQMPKTAGGVVSAPENGEAGAFAEALKAFRTAAKENAAAGEAGIAIAISGDVTSGVPELPIKIQTEAVIGLEAVLVPPVGSEAAGPAAPVVETPPVLGIPVAGVDTAPVLPGETTDGETTTLPEAPDADAIVAAAVAPVVTFAPPEALATTDDIALKIAAAAADAPPAAPQTQAPPAIADADGAAAPDTAPLIEGRAATASAPPPPVLNTGNDVPVLSKEVLETFAPRAQIVAANDDTPLPAATPAPQQATATPQSTPIPAEIKALASDPDVVSIQGTVTASADKDDGTASTPAQNTAPRTAVAATPTAPVTETTQPVLTVSEPELAAGAETRAKAADGALSVLTQKPDTASEAAKTAAAPVEPDASASKAAAPADPVADKPVDVKAAALKDAVTDKAPADQAATDKFAPADKTAPTNDNRAAQNPVPVNDKPSVSEVAAKSAQQQAQSLPATAIPQIASEFASKAKRGATRFEIRLDPPELGRIDVRIDVDKDGRVTSRLMIEKTETLDLLKADQRALERALHDAGFKSEQNSLSFSLKDDRGNQAKFDEQRQASSQFPPGETEEEPVRHVADSAYRAALRGPGGLDLRV
jgi:flagellar hook-length control protein FliK